MKITILKNYRDKETLRNVEIEALVQMIAECKYQEEVSELRSIYPILKLKREDDGQIDGAENYTDRIPRVCFASVLANINGQRVNKGYTALALLEVNNLTTLEEAEAIRNGAALMRQKSRFRASVLEVNGYQPEKCRFNVHNVHFSFFFRMNRHHNKAFSCLIGALNSPRKVNGYGADYAARPKVKAVLRVVGLLGVREAC